jgi:ribosomal protein S12 methylthiotransferase
MISTESGRASSTLGRPVYLLSLGCAKNLVDSECMSQILRTSGFDMVDDPAAAEILLINTCGFIESAKKEAIAKILELADYKQPAGAARYLIVAGCLAQRYADDILSCLPEVSAVLGTADYYRIGDIIAELDQLADQSACQLPRLPGMAGSLKHLTVARQPSTPPTYAYIKVAEGCSNCCAYCAIPGIRGPYVSRPFEELVQEAQNLSAAGYSELILIAQDTTRYGLDLYGRRLLPELLRAICALPEVRMVRFLYSYSDGLTDELIQTMASESKVAHYLDLPIQHASDAILLAMNRRDSQDNLRTIIRRCREAMPDLVLRTTVLTGFPGETDQHFAELVQFVKEIRFNHLGCFIFSAEEGTPAAAMRPRIRKTVARARMQEIMSVQREISRDLAQARIGKPVDVTLESVSDDGVFYIGRSYAEAPDVDPVIYVAAGRPDLKLGQTVAVRLVAAGEYDFTGVTIE